MAIIAFDIVGSGIGLLIAPHFDKLFDLWIGGALAGPLGFMAGLCWQLARRDRTPHLPVAETIFVGALVFMVCGFACFFAIPFAKAQMRMIAQMKSIDGSDIQSITVYDESGDRKLVDISDRQTLMEFADQCKDIKGYSPQHKVYTSAWHVVLDGTTTQEFDFQYQASMPQAVIGEFILGGDSTFGSHGNFSSVGLRDWFTRHVPNAE